MNVKDIYVKRLELDGNTLANEAKEIENAFKAELDTNLDEAKKTEKIIKKQSQAAHCTDTSVDAVHDWLSGKE